MSNLISRAHSLLTRKPALIGALAILPLASAVQRAHAVTPAVPFILLTGTTSYQSSASGGSTLIDSTNSLSSTGNNPIRLSTLSTITVPSSTYENNQSSNYTLAWTGFLGTPFFPVGSQVSQTYDFTLGLSSGSVDWNLTTLIDNEPALIASGTASADSNHITGTTSETLTAIPTTSLWSTTLTLSWIGFTDPATMTISVPNTSSIDLAVTPEPASLTLLALGAATLLTRRRKI